MFPNGRSLRYVGNAVPTVTFRLIRELIHLMMEKVVYFIIIRISYFIFTINSLRVITVGSEDSYSTIKNQTEDDKVQTLTGSCPRVV